MRAHESFHATCNISGKIELHFFIRRSIYWGHSNSQARARTAAGNQSDKHVIFPFLVSFIVFRFHPFYFIAGSIPQSVGWAVPHDSPRHYLPKCTAWSSFSFIIQYKELHEKNIRPKYVNINDILNICKVNHPKQL